MNNANLIESLEYQIYRIQEKNKVENSEESEEDKKQRNIRRAGLLGSGIGLWLVHNSNNKPLVIHLNKDNSSVPKESLKKKVKNVTSKIHSKLGNSVIKNSKKAAIGAGVVGAGIAAKKAYDHFKNKKK